MTNLTHATAEPRYSPYYIRTIKEVIPMQTITRAALIQCVEAGINRTRTRGGLPAYQQTRLRLVALTAKRITIGGFGTLDSGCPLTQAGLGLDSGCVSELCGGDTALTAFYEGFDPLVRDVTQNFSGSLLTVVE